MKSTKYGIIPNEFEQHGPDDCPASIVSNRHSMWHEVLANASDRTPHQDLSQVSATSCKSMAEFVYGIQPEAQMPPGPGGGMQGDEKTQKHKFQRPGGTKNKCEHGSREQVSPSDHIATRLGRK